MQKLGAFSDLRGSKILLQGQVSKGVEAVFAFYEQSTLADLLEKDFCGNFFLTTHLCQRLFNDSVRLGSFNVTLLTPHHMYSEFSYDRSLLWTGQSSRIG